MRFIWSILKFLAILLVCTFIWMGFVFGESDAAAWIIIIASFALPIYLIIKLVKK